MEPLSRRTFVVVFAVCAVFCVACVCFSSMDAHSMDFTDADLEGYAPSVNDTIGYKVEDNGSEYLLDFVVTSVSDGTVCNVIRYSIDGSYQAQYQGITLPDGMIGGDVTKLADSLTLKKTKTAVDTTDYAKLTCTRYKYTGGTDGFSDILVKLGIPLGSHSLPDSTDITLRMYTYSDNLVDYNLVVRGDGGADDYSLRFSMYRLVTSDS